MESKVMQYTDQQLQLALAKMLPNIIRADHGTEGDDLHFEWLIEPMLMRVREAEWLHVCWLVEESLTATQWHEYARSFPDDNSVTLHSQWQQRTIALAQVKGVEIV